MKIRELEEIVADLNQYGSISYTQILKLEKLVVQMKKEARVYNTQMVFDGHLMRSLVSSRKDYAPFMEHEIKRGITALAQEMFLAGYIKGERLIERRDGTETIRLQCHVKKLPGSLYDIKPRELVDEPRKPYTSSEYYSDLPQKK